MSKHSIRSGRLSRLSALAKLLERLDAAEARALAVGGVALERQLGVLLGELLQAPLLAAPGGAHLHPGAPQVGQELREGVRRSHVRRNHDQGRDAGRAAVVLEAERLEQLRDVLPGLVLQIEGMPVDQPAAAQREDLHRGRPAARGDPDHVHRADRPLVRGLALGQVAYRCEPVAVAGSLLELLPLGRSPHLLLQLALDGPRLAGEELDHAVDDRAVVLLRHVADAGREAAFDVVVEARDARVPPRLRPLARPVGEDAVQDVERLPHLLRRRVRAEVDDPAPVPLPREHDSRVLVLHGHRDVGVALVVTEADVERRPVALDQVLLEVERLHLGRGDDHLDLLDALDQPVEPEP